MFAQQLSNMANQPYSHEVNEIVSDAMGILMSECTGLANRGVRQLTTTAQYYDGDYDRRTFYFGNWGENYCCLSRVPVNMLDYVFTYAQEQLRSQLQKEGFKNIKVEGVTDGPFYNPLYVFGRRTFLQDKSNPKFKKYIRISVSW